MELDIYKELLSKCEEDIDEIANSLDIEKIENEIFSLEEKTFQEGFWDDSEKAQTIIKDMNFLKEKIDKYKDLVTRLDEAIFLIELMEEEDDYSYMDELKRLTFSLDKSVKAVKIETVLNGEFDKNNAIFSIHAGAGGLEAQDWAEMLLRMYTRWLDSKKYKYEYIDYQRDTEGGIKAVTLRIVGRNAYGFLKSEKGVHRLIRISPFDSSGKRHTSFASVDVFPELEDLEKIDIDISELKIDTYRASGAGGQHVNTTDSAVRITHLPTGIIVQCQNERSQHSNRETAMKMLASKLMKLKIDEQKDRIEDLQGNYNQIGWGSQIRSYVFHPYNMVKDHRTNCEVGNIDSVMDGDIDVFINEYLAQKAKENL